MDFNSVTKRNDGTRIDSKVDLINEKDLWIWDNVLSPGHVKKVTVEEVFLTSEVMIVHVERALTVNLLI